jgi:hypothetical protein
MQFMSFESNETWRMRIVRASSGAYLTYISFLTSVSIILRSRLFKLGRA